VTVDFTVVLPELIVALTAVLLMLADLYLPRSKRSWLAWLSLAGLAVAASAVVAQHASNKTGFSGSVVMDGFSLFCDGVFLLAGVMVVLLSMDYLSLEHINLGEYYVLLLGTLAGMMLMASANSLIVIFLALETFSIGLYVLAGFERGRPRSQEAALKYFLLSAFASGFLLYGMALVYGATGSTMLEGISSALKSGTPGDDPILLAGMGLMLVGFAFKMSAVPFHAWTPDVYQGAPTPVTALMSVGTKLAAFAAFIRLFVVALPSVHVHWLALIWLLAMVTMVLGNVAAVVQTNVKRMLAYSSIAQAGYLLIAVYTARGDGGSGDGVPSLLFYFVVYACMNIGAFAVVTALARRSEDHTGLPDFAGLGFRSPWLGGSMALFMFSLASFPPTAGFWGKFYIFQTALEDGHGELAVVGVLGSLISVYYYLRVVYVMYFTTPAEDLPRPSIPFGIAGVLVLSIGGTVLLGLWPNGILTLAQGARLLL
jgi:NADH-quinone oxidoreductase subunit N